LTVAAETDAVWHCRDERRMARRVLRRGAGSEHNMPGHRTQTPALARTLISSSDLGWFSAARRRRGSGPSL